MKKQSQKRRIAFVLTSFVVGGVEKSFLSLLDQIDRTKYDITAFIPDDNGAWTSLLKEKCDVQYLKIESFRTLMRSHLKQTRFLEIFRCLFFRALARMHYKKAYRKSTAYFIRSMPRIKERFDCVIAYQIINDDCVLSSLYRLRAPKKIIWSHAFIRKNEALYGQWYNKFDKIFCVSKFAKNAFVDNFPWLSEKTEVVHNIIDVQQIRNLSDEPVSFTYDPNYTAIVTVGRLSQEKGQLMIPEIAQLLKRAGYKVAWYLIGAGDLKADICKEIAARCVQDSVFLLGSINNPYPYIKACDIYVQTSVFEGWGLTVSEAKVLAKPIVTTDAGVMSEQIQDEINGLLVSDADPNALAQAIARLIDNPALRDTLIQNLRVEDISPANELEKLYSAIG